MSRTALTQKLLRALEAVFAAEIDNRLPFQSKAKVYTELEKDGYIEPFSRVFGSGERFPVTVSGYVLTHAGRYAYCSQCGAEEASSDA